MISSLPRLSILLLAAAGIEGCSHSSGLEYPSNAGTSACASNWVLICPMDRPTVSDSRTVRASAACRCQPLVPGFMSGP